MGKHLLIGHAEWVAEEVWSQCLDADGCAEGTVVVACLVGREDLIFQPPHGAGSEVLVGAVFEGVFDKGKPEVGVRVGVEDGVG